MSGFEQPMQANPGTEPQFKLLQDFESELERYARITNTTEGLLGPILEAPSPEATSTPEEVPTNELHKAVLRFRSMNRRAEDLQRRIKL